jgi:hypothetical protein
LGGVQILASTWRKKKKKREIKMSGSGGKCRKFELKMNEM